MRRLFFALWPDTGLRREFADIAGAIAGPNGRPVAVENLHLTLVFLGNLEEETVARLTAATDTVAAARFELHVDTLGSWHRGRVIWLAPSAIPGALLSLVTQLRERAGTLDVPLETRPYRPHITICRRLVDPAAHYDREFRITWPVDGFALLESTQGAAGVRYEIVRRWGLGRST